MKGPTPKPFLKAFACAAVVYVVVVTAVVSAWAPPGNSTVAAQFLGYLFGFVSVAALIVGFFARRAAKVWPIWKIIVLYLLALIVLLAVLLAGKVKPPA